MAKAPAIADLDERQAKFVELYVELGNANEAARQAGYADTTASNARALILGRSSVAWAVAVATRKRFADLAPICVKNLEELAKHAKSESVRLDANKALLDRGGFVAPRSMVEKPKDDKPLHEMTTAELQAQADRLHDELAGRAKPISSAQVAPQDTQETDLIG